MLSFPNRPGLAIGDRRFDGEGTTREDAIAELATLDPSFDPAGKSDAYLLGRLDHARENQAGTADAAEAEARHRAAEAWKPTGTRTDAASIVDADEAMRRSRKRTADAWKNRSGVQLLESLTDEDDEGKNKKDTSTKTPVSGWH